MNTLRNTWKRYPAILYIFVITGLFCALLYQDFVVDVDSSAVRYAAILTSVGFCIYTAVISKGRKIPLLTLGALSFTAVADYFLLIRGDHLEWGMLAFNVVQAFHFAHIYSLQKTKPYISLAVRLTCSLIAIIALACTNSLLWLTFLVAMYLPNLLVNAVDSMLLCKKNPSWWVLTLGFLLFIGCDICVGLGAMNNVLDVGLPYSVTHFCVYATWVFYMPSQALLSLSGYNHFKGVCFEDTPYKPKETT